MDDTTTQDPNSQFPTFDYNLEADKVLRRQKIAQMLQQQALAPAGQGQVIQNSTGTWYVPGQGSGIAGGIAKVLGAYLSTKMQGSADQDQAALTTQADQRLAQRNQQLSALLSPQSSQPLPSPQAGAQAYADSGSPQATPQTVTNGPGDPGPQQGQPQVDSAALSQALSQFPSGNAPSAPAAPSQPAQDPNAQRMAILAAMSHEGPQAQKESDAIMASQFTHNDRYQLIPDPVNGGFMELDKVSGNTAPVSQGKGNTPITSQMTRDDGTVMNVHKDGSMTPALNPDGTPVVSQTHNADVRAKTDQNVAIAQKKQSNASAVASIDNALGMLDRQEQLYSAAHTGPVESHVMAGPLASDADRELDALNARDIFSETRNALAGAQTDGGAPRIAQSEFKFMASNGGLTRSMDPKVATNIINQQRSQLQKLRQTLVGYGTTLDGTTSSTPSVPAKGQTVSAADYGFQ